MPAFLTSDQIDDWNRDGVLVLPRFAAPDAVASLRARAQALVDAFEPAVGGSAVFSSRDRDRLAQQALADSAGAVRCFLEEEAVDDQGRLRVPKARAVNKIGHALHDRDPVFDRFSRDPRLAALVADLGVADPRLVQSMLIFKQPRIGGEVMWHQDASFLITEPSSVLGLWFALEDASCDNGCLWVAPGAHRGPQGVLRERYQRRDDGAGFEMVRLDDTPWPQGAQTRALEVQAGALVVFHGHLPHASAPNRSSQSRLAYTLHVVDGRARWAPGNWLQRDASDPPRGFHDAGPN